MKTKNVLIKLLIFSQMVFLASCSDEEQGRESLIGYWEVEEVVSSHGYFYEDGGHDGLDEVVNTNDPGFFEFKDDVVNYSLFRDGTLYQGSSEWFLTVKKERNGFNRNKVFEITIIDLTDFIVEFGDNTRNSEKRAKTMDWLHWPKTEGQNVAIQMFLKKK
ncbi:hypothetical protein [Roseivirga sp.]|uniref:hypothetical protein n=1 Tax=Roseivirga sp. TaxID=1964215 RepID=UPI003B52DF9C